jgi:hypothetical protein
MFNIHSTTFKYFDHSYNNTKFNERCVEIPLGFYFLNTFDVNSIIEIGAVMPYYSNNIVHKVYDIIDPYDKCIRDDLTKINFSFNDINVLSISTIEHIGKGDYGLDVDNESGITFLKKIIQESKNYLITFPWGYNKNFDEQILQNNINFILIKRVSEFDWKVVTNDNVNNIQYNTPYSCGNSVVLITNLKF